jgi:hypothetical protein
VIARPRAKLAHTARGARKVTAGENSAFRMPVLKPFVSNNPRALGRVLRQTRRLRAVIGDRRGRSSQCPERRKATLVGWRNTDDGPNPGSHLRRSAFLGDPGVAAAGIPALSRLWHFAVLFLTPPVVYSPSVTSGVMPCILSEGMHCTRLRSHTRCFVSSVFACILAIIHHTPFSRFHPPSRQGPVVYYVLRYQGATFRGYRKHNCFRTNPEVLWVIGYGPMYLARNVAFWLTIRSETTVTSKDFTTRARPRTGGGRRIAFCEERM